MAEPVPRSGFWGNCKPTSLWTFFIPIYPNPIREGIRPPSVVLPGFPSDWVLPSERAPFFCFINIWIMTWVIPIWHMSNHTIWAGIMFVLKTIGLVDRKVAWRATTWPGLYWTDQTNQLKHLGVWRWLCVNNVLPAGWRHFLLTSTRSRHPVCSCKHAGKSFIKHSGIKKIKKTRSGKIKKMSGSNGWGFFFMNFFYEKLDCLT